MSVCLLVTSARAMGKINIKSFQCYLIQPIYFALDICSGGFDGSGARLLLLVCLPTDSIYFSFCINRTFHNTFASIISHFFVFLVSNTFEKLTLKYFLIASTKTQTGEGKRIKTKTTTRKKTYSNRR